MNRMLSIFVATLLLNGASQAADITTERLENAYEVQRFIVNYAPSGQNLGRVLAAICPECPTQTFTFDQLTLLEIDGKLRPITEIGKKAEWSGVITITNQEPDKIIKFSIY